MFALVDCNNFYASCQRVFRPELEGKPIVVLSNNDGCIIARSNEAKDLGIPMGAPHFQWQGFMRDNSVHVFSSNYALYGDMSARVMSVLERLNPDIEVYSIDEAFLGLAAVPRALLEEHARSLHDQVRKWVGLPVSVGIAPTKTLAKLANHVAKKDLQLDGILVLDSDDKLHRYLRKVKIGNVWGIGRRWAEQLQHNGMRSAADLAAADHRWIRKRYGVVLQRTAMELCGISCISIEQTEPRQQILVSRSFRPKVSEYHKLREMLSGYIARAGEKLRDQHSLAKNITVFIRTKADKHTGHYENTRSINMSQYTADTATLIKAGCWGLDHLYRQGEDYYRAGVMLNDLTPDKNQQLSLFSKANYDSAARKRMQVLDAVNRRYGHETLCYASEARKRWQMHQEFLSPAYTTRWGDLLEVE